MTITSSALWRSGSLKSLLLIHVSHATARRRSGATEMRTSPSVTEGAVPFSASALAEESLLIRRPSSPRTQSLNVSGAFSPPIMTPPGSASCAPTRSITKCWVPRRPARISCSAIFSCAMPCTSGSSASVSVIDCPRLSEIGWMARGGCDVTGGVWVVGGGEAGVAGGARADCRMIAASSGDEMTES